MPDPDAVATRAQRHGLTWLTVQAIEGPEVLDADWLRAMRAATRERAMRLGVHGYIGRPRPRPVAEARAMSKAIRVAEADFAIVNAEIEYERSATGAPQKFVDAYRGLRPRFTTYLSSFGRPTFHPGLDWAVWPAPGSAACLRPTRT